MFQLRVKINNIQESISTLYQSHSPLRGMDTIRTTYVDKLLWPKLLDRSKTLSYKYAFKTLVVPWIMSVREDI